jgi:hypothetical protein
MSRTCLKALQGNIVAFFLTTVKPETKRNLIFNQKLHTGVFKSYFKNFTVLRLYDAILKRKNSSLD